MTEVDEAIEHLMASGLPGLKERALAAAQVAAEAKAEANAECYEELRKEMYSALVNILNIDAGTAAAACDKARNGTKSATAGDSLAGRDENLCVRVTVDKLIFRGHYMRTKIFDGQASTEKKEFAGEDIYDDEFVFEWQAPHASIYPVKSLAELGSLLKEKLK